jgi:DNA-binding CsgD family transcriptional regulator
MSLAARIDEHYAGISCNPVLTKRQRECLKWVREGKSSTDIGVILGISGRVVDEHVAHACERLGVRTRVQAVFAATTKGCLDA